MVWFSDVCYSDLLGRALQNKSVGDVVLLKLPAITRQLKIVELVTIHEGGAE